MKPSNKLIFHMEHFIIMREVFSHQAGNIIIKIHMAIKLNLKVLNHCQTYTKHQHNVLGKVHGCSS